MYKDRDLIELSKYGDRKQSAGGEPFSILTPVIN